MDDNEFVEPKPSASRSAEDGRLDKAQVNGYLKTLCGRQVPQRIDIWIHQRLVSFFHHQLHSPAPYFSVFFLRLLVPVGSPSVHGQPRQKAWSGRKAVCQWQMNRRM
jgi:hypothetical protein